MMRNLVVATVLIAGATGAAIYAQYGEGLALQAAHGDLPRKLEGKELAESQPAVIDTLKEEAELVLWMGTSGDWRLLAIDPACQLPSETAPKFKTGMHQAPKGFEQASLRQFDPSGGWRLSLNLEAPSSGYFANSQNESILTILGGRATASCDAISEIGDEKRVSVTVEQGKRSVTVYIVSPQAVAGNPDIKSGCDGFGKERGVPRQEGSVDS